MEDHFSVTYPSNRRHISNFSKQLTVKVPLWWGKKKKKTDTASVSKCLCTDKKVLEKDWL